jgi:hypothetical protein
VGATILYRLAAFDDSASDAGARDELFDHLVDQFLSPDARV